MLNNLVAALFLFLSNRSLAQAAEVSNYKSTLVSSQWWDLAKLSEVPAAKTKIQCGGQCMIDTDCNIFSMQGGTNCQLGTRDITTSVSPSGQDVAVYGELSACVNEDDDVCLATPAVVDEVSYPNTNYHASEGHIFVDGCDGLSVPTYWLSPNGQTTSFRLMVSSDATYDKPNMIWKTVVDDALPTVTNGTPCSSVQMVTYSFFPEKARFFKFVVDGISGYSGGLKYIKIE